MDDVTDDMLQRRAKLKADAILRKQAENKIPYLTAVLAAYVEHKRRLLQCSESGVLSITSARLKDIYHVKATAAIKTFQGSDTVCTEVMITGHPDNVGLIWVRPYTEATIYNAWPLAKGDVIGFTIDNLQQLRIFIVTENDKAIVAYTR